MGLVLTGWSRYVSKARVIHRESGVSGLFSRMFHKMASPAIDWGGVTFFVRPLDATVPQPGDEGSGIQLRRVAAAEIQDLKEGGDPTQDLRNLVERFERGDHAYAAIAESGQPAHLRWVTTSRGYIPELDRDLVLSPHQAYFYNGYTRPDMRGRGIDGLVRNFIFRTLRAEGYTEVFSYVREDNPTAFRAASRWQRRVGSLWYIRIGRFAPIVIGRSPAGLRLLKVRPHAADRVGDER